MKGLKELLRKGLIMTDKRKLPRIPMVDKYTTGDAQDWTYEYTWEDFNAAITMWPTAPITSPEGKLKNEIIQYFRNHPELLSKNGISELELNILMKVVSNSK